MTEDDQTSTVEEKALLTSAIISLGTLKDGQKDKATKRIEEIVAWYGEGLLNEKTSLRPSVIIEKLKEFQDWAKAGKNLFEKAHFDIRALLFSAARNHTFSVKFTKGDNLKIKAGRTDDTDHSSQAFSYTGDPRDVGISKLEGGDDYRYFPSAEFFSSDFMGKLSLFQYQIESLIESINTHHPDKGGKKTRSTIAGPSVKKWLVGQCIKLFVEFQDSPPNTCPEKLKEFAEYVFQLADKDAHKAKEAKGIDRMVEAAFGRFMKYIEIKSRCGREIPDFSKAKGITYRDIEPHLPLIREEQKAYAAFLNPRPARSRAKKKQAEKK